MLEFLKKLASKSEDVVVVEPGALDVVGYTGQYLRFVSPYSVPMEAPFQAVIDLPALGPTPVPLRVVSRAPHEDGTLHIAFVEADAAVMERLLEKFGPLEEEESESWADKRACPRYAVECRVSSPALPHYEACMVGLGAQGARLEVRGPVPPDTRFTMTVDPGEPGLAPLTLTGTVVWCSTMPVGGFWLGLRFAELPPAERQALEAWIGLLQARHQPPE